MRDRDPLIALSMVLRSVDAARNTRALGVLLGTFASAGLLVAMAERSLAVDAGVWGPAQGMAALLVAFYGGNAAGILVMDGARGGGAREVPLALRAALGSAHRLLVVLAFVGVLGAVAGALLIGLFWLARPAVSGPVIGAMLFGAAVPLGVVVTGLAALATVAVVVPLAAPAVWSGARPLATLHFLGRLVRHRLLVVVLLMSAVGVLTAGMGAISTFVVVAGGRIVAQLAVALVGVEVPPQQLMAGLFGYGLRSLGALGAPAASNGYGAAALVGGGVVFAVALALPGLVYLRGSCAVYLAMAEDAGSDRSDR
jgi:hypothetical protein